MLAEIPVIPVLPDWRGPSPVGGEIAAPLPVSAGSREPGPPCCCAPEGHVPDGEGLLRSLAYSGVTACAAGERRCGGSLGLERAHATHDDPVSLSLSSLNWSSFFLYVQRGTWIGQGSLFLPEIPSVPHVWSRRESAGLWLFSGPLLSTQRR